MITISFQSLAGYPGAGENQMQFAWGQDFPSAAAAAGLQSGIPPGLPGLPGGQKTIFVRLKSA